MSFLEKIKEFIVNFKDLGIIGASSGISNLIGAVFWLVLASIIGTEDYGRISYYLAIAIIASRISLLGAPNTLLVYSSKGEKIQSPMYFLTFVSSVITSLMLFFVFMYDSSISVYVIGFVVYTLVTSELLAKKKFKKYAKIIISQKILLVCLAFSLYYIIGINGVILGIAISFLPYAIMIFKEFKKDRMDFGLLKKHGRFIVNSYVLDLSTSFNGTLDKIIILPILGFGLLGNYHLGMQFFSLLTIIPVIFFQYLLPRDARAEANNRFRKVLIIFSIILAVLGSVVAPKLIPIFYPQFNEAVDVIQIVSFAVIPYTIVTILMSKFLGGEKSTIALSGSLIFLGIQIPLIIFLGQNFGIVGVSISLIIAYGIQGLFLGIMSKIK